jgi:transposase
MRNQGKDDAMNLKQSRYKDGRIWLSIVKKFSQDGISKTRTVEKIGWLHELEGSFDDPIAHFKAYAKELTERERELSAPRTITIHPLKKIDTRTDNRKNLGFAALSSIYFELGLDVFFNNRQRHKNFEYSTDGIIRLLSFDRILHPSSKKSAWEGRGAYFESFDFSLDDTYRALTHAARFKDALMVHLNRRISELYGRDTELVYYDVTNYYFEIDKPDTLRKKGVSKEHRPDPIVQMGLLMDKGGLPVAFDLFAGNTVDCETLIPVLERIKGRGDAGDFGFARVICVADKGLNTSDNIAALLAEGDGYVFSKSVRKADGGTLEWILDGIGYRTSNKGDDGGFKIKERITEREINVTVKAADKARGIKKKTKKVKVTEKQVAFYSEKYDRRAKAERADAVQKARTIAAHPTRLKSMLDKTAAKYIKGVTVDDNGEICELKEVLFFDEAKLAAEEALDGYYIVSTSEADRDSKDIIDIYRGLWRIEETFRITKSDFCARPVYVSRQDHIEAHFMVCFIALLIMRVLQMKCGWRHSAAAIADTLAAASGTYEGDNWWLFDHREAVIDDIGTTLGLDFTKERLTAGQIRSLVGFTKKVGR